MNSDEMTFEQIMGYTPYVFAYDRCTHLVLKSPQLIRETNARLHATSPESEYPLYRWYLPDEEAPALGHRHGHKLRQVAWHGGIPFYTLELDDGRRIDVAEFYVSGCTDPD